MSLYSSKGLLWHKHVTVDGAEAQAENVLGRFWHTFGLTVDANNNYAVTLEDRNAVTCDTFLSTGSYDRLPNEPVDFRC